MALPIFAPRLEPSPGTGRKTNYRLLKAEFGEGYTQTARAGINHRRRELTLSWATLPDDQAWDSACFLDGKGGDQSFLYTPPRESEPVKWTCEEWDDTVNDNGTRRITATLVQSFTHET